MVFSFNRTLFWRNFSDFIFGNGFASTHPRTGCEDSVVGGIAFSDSDDCDDNHDDGASSVSSVLRLLQDQDI